MNYVIFGIILAHIVFGFGWLLYKLEFQKKKSDKNKNSNTKPENK